MTNQKQDNDFVYVTFIKTTPEKLWKALTNSEFTKQYWFGLEMHSDWKIGSPISYVSNGSVKMAGKILESTPPKVLAYTFHEELTEAKDEPPTKVTLTIEKDPRGDFVKLTVVHTDFVENSLHRPSISKGWPAVLSGLKSLLETGETIPF